MTFRRLSTLMCAAFVLGSCASASSQRQETGRQFRQILAECTERSQASGYVAVIRCVETPVRRLYDRLEYPYMDLVDLYLAHWSSIAQKVDAGQLSPEEAQLQLMEQLFRVTAEAQRRDGAYSDHRVLLMELRPMLPPRR